MYVATTPQPQRNMTLALAVLLLAMLSLASTAVSAEDTVTRSHGYHPFGNLRYDADFAHFDYVNPDAPKGGTLRLYGQGTFDSLNPYILRGRSPENTPGMQLYGFTQFADSLLMGHQDHSPVGDDSGAAYGLIAEWLEYPQSFEWVTFKLRDNAQFHDGKPITAADVVFSVDLLREHGHPQYALRLSDVTKVEALDSHRVRFTFSEGRRDLPAVAGAIPILPKHYWTERDFDDASLTPHLSSGPYRVTRVEAGRRVVLSRVEDYWARDLPVNRGRYNFDQVVFEYYRDNEVGFEAFKSGRYDIHYDYSARRWATGYDFPAHRDGRVVRDAIPHRLPRPVQAFFFNTRRAPFNDPVVRQAFNLLFDFEWSNRQLFHDAYTRTASWFPNSPYSASGPITSEQQAIFDSLSVDVPESVLTADIDQPVNDGSGRIRQRQREALTLLQSAGWRLQNQQLVNDSGQPLRFTVLNYHNPGIYRILAPWFENLKRLGIQAEYREVDPAAYKERLDRFDYDMVLFVLPMRSYPGPELLDYISSQSAEISGSRNVAGIRSPVVDALLQRVSQASDERTYTHTLQALDRYLLSQHFGVLNYHITAHRLAWWDRFSRPEAPSPYALGLDTWWVTELEEP